MAKRPLPLLVLCLLVGSALFAISFGVVSVGTARALILVMLAISLSAVCALALNMRASNRSKPSTAERRFPSLAIAGAGTVAAALAWGLWRAAPRLVEAERSSPRSPVLYVLVICTALIVIAGWLGRRTANRFRVWRQARRAPEVLQRTARQLLDANERGVIGDEELVRKWKAARERAEAGGRTPLLRTPLSGPKTCLSKFQPQTAFR